MFEIQPSAEFSSWFESLSPTVAEEVACALDMLAAAGTALGPSHASRALLWFDGTGGGGMPPYFEHHEIMLRRYAALGLDTQELLLWQREIVRCLESEAFRERLAQLEPGAAALALATVESLKNRLRAARARIALEASLLRRPIVLWPGGLTPREEQVLRLRSAIPELSEDSLSSALKRTFFDVLRLVGIEPAQIMNSASGLCELTIDNTEPKLRVLFGLDAPARRIVALLGEPLTRAYYGDSVQLAEQRWREYCSSDARQQEAR